MLSTHRGGSHVLTDVICHPICYDGFTRQMHVGDAFASTCVGVDSCSSHIPPSTAALYSYAAQVDASAHALRQTVSSITPVVVLWMGDPRQERREAGQLKAALGCGLQAAAPAAVDATPHQ